MANPLSMSDDDFLKINPTDYGSDAIEPQTPAEPSSPNPETAEPTNADTPVEPTPEAGDGDATDNGTPAVPEGEGVVTPEGEPEPAPEPEATPAAAPVPEAGKPAQEPKDKAKEPVTTATEAPDYQGFYEQVMKPFKANGRTIELKSPDEVIRLMQMGAGFGRKMQDIQPHLKVLRMLEKNNLLDESRLSFLIDINERNPDAVKQLIKDSGIDPLDIDPADNVVYQPKNHAVTDQEVRFHEAVQEVHSTPGGTETIETINKQWDDESKSVLWDQPELLGIIQSQRESGVYDLISAEMDRQKMLGIIPQNTSFLKAYKTAGDYLASNGQIGQPPQQTPAEQKLPVQKPQPQVLATRPVSQQKPKVAHNDKAAAAAATTPAGRKATPSVNPLALSDDDFLKQFGDRL